MSLPAPALLSARRPPNQPPLSQVSPTVSKHIDFESGLTYYYDASAQTSSYDRPESYSTSLDAFGEARNELLPAADILSSRRSNAQTPSEDVDEVWSKYVDDAETGYPYYYNSSTGESSYERPAGFSTIKSSMTATQRGRVNMLKLYNEACSLQGSGDYRSAAAVFQTLADQGHPLAAHNLARLHERGQGVDRDPVAAIRL